MAKKRNIILLIVLTILVLFLFLFIQMKEGYEGIHRSHNRHNRHHTKPPVGYMNGGISSYHEGTNTYDDEKTLKTDQQFADQLRYNQSHEPEYNPKTDIEKGSETADICATYNKCVSKNGVDACQAFKASYC